MAMVSMQPRSSCGSLTTRGVAGTSMSWTSASPSTTQLSETPCEINTPHELSETPCEINTPHELSETPCEINTPHELSETPCEINTPHDCCHNLCCIYVQGCHHSTTHFTITSLHFQLLTLVQYMYIWHKG